jgi:hypothetical protein
MNFIFTKNIGMLLLAIYLIVIGLSAIAALAISGVITGVLALGAGIFIPGGRHLHSLSEGKMKRTVFMSCG